MRHRLLLIESTKDFERNVLDLLGAHHDVQVLDCGAQIHEKIEAFQPELILLDFHLSDCSAVEICRTIRREFVDRQIQLLILGNRLDESQRLDLFAAGADDIIDKSIGRLELTAKIDVLTRLRSALMRATAAERKLEGYSRELERIVEARSLAIQATQDIAVFALAKLADSRDTETGEHLVRMRAYSQIIAEQLKISGPYRDLIDDQFLSDLYRSSPLHDIGKVGISDEILLKPGRLTPEEFTAMKEHVRIGAETLEEAARSGPSGSFFHMAAEIARCHHERWDGKGYLQGLSGTDISLAARIVSVADVFDALSSKRIYKDAIDFREARQMVCDGSGTQFDPAVVVAFEQSFDKIASFANQTGHSIHFQSTVTPQNAIGMRGKHNATAGLISGEKAIVIENGSSSAKLIAAWLKNAGMEVRRCVEYASAKHLIREDCPTLIVADWQEDPEAGEMFFRWIHEEYLPQYVYTMVVADRRMLPEWASAVSLGIDDVLATTVSREELISRVTSAMRVVELENNLRSVERNDPLTGLATLRYLKDQLKREWGRARNYHLPISCVMIDIDDFREINEEYGVEAGDQVLLQLAKTISDAGRTMDYLCRLERDRLLLVLPECAEVNAYRAAKRISRQIGRLSVSVAGQAINVSVSMGVAERTSKVEDLETLIANSEMALRVAKSSGKCRIVCLGDCLESAGEVTGEDYVRQRLEHLTAAEIMSKPIFTACEDETVAEVARFLVQHGIKSIPVVDAEGYLTGVVSEKDLMRAFRQPNAWSIPVSDVMVRDVVRFEEFASCLQIYEFLSQSSLRRVIIVNEERPTGIISRGNCLRYIQSLENGDGLQDPQWLTNMMDSGVFETASLSQLREILRESGPKSESCKPSHTNH
ncbi:diguanylate cyclase [bacterium]|nr:diguanylate cyclase [bacterium]